MEGRGLSMDKNWPVVDNMDLYVSVGQIPLHHITTIISVASKSFKKGTFLKMCYCLLEGHMEKEL